MYQHDESRFILIQVRNIFQDQSERERGFGDMSKVFSLFMNAIARY